MTSAQMGSSEMEGPTERPLSPDEDEDGFAVVGPIHNPRGPQERDDHINQAWVHLVHLIKEKR